MRFSCPSHELQRGTQIAVRATPSRPTTVPILSNVLIQAVDSQVILTCYDQEVGIRVTLPAVVEVAGEATCHAKTLSDLMNDLPAADVVVSLDDRQNVTLSCGKSEFTLAGLAPEDFPLLPDVGDDTRFLIQSSLLRDVIKQTIFAVCDDESRPALTGVFFSIEPDKLTAVSTDTHRLCIREVNLPGLVGETEIILPARALDQFTRALPTDTDPTVEIRIARNQAQLQCSGVTVVSRLVEGPFPHYQRVLPSGFDKLLTVEREPLLRALKRVAVVARSEKAHRVVLKGTDALLELTSESSGVGRVYEEVPSTLEGEQVELVFNCGYLTDVLSVMEWKVVRLEVSGKLTPCIVRGEDDETYRYVVMPMQMA